MSSVDLLVSTNTAGSSGSCRVHWPFSRHKLSKLGLLLASDHLLSPSPLASSLSLTTHESICQKSGQDKDQKVRFK